MALTAEEARAAEYNRSLVRRKTACQARAAQLNGNASAAKTLTDRTQAFISGDESYEQRIKIGYDRRNETGCGEDGQIVNG